MPKVKQFKQQAFSLVDLVLNSFGGFIENLNIESRRNLSVDDGLQSVLSCFDRGDLSYVPIFEDDNVKGVVSKADFADFLYSALLEYSEDWDHRIFHEFQIGELMLQPIVEVQIEDPKAEILEKFLNHRAGSVVLKKGDEFLSVVTERDMILYLVKELEKSTSVSKKLGSHLSLWLERNGMARVSRLLSNIGI